MVIEDLVEKFKDVKVLIIGDIMLDQYTFGTVNRISPEAPVPVLNFERIIMKPGGAGNTAYNIKNLNGQITLCGVIGNDINGQVLQQLLSLFDIKTHLYTSDFWITILKHRIIAHNQQIVRIDKEPKQKNSEHEQYIIDFINQNHKEIDVVVVSDYDKGTITDNILFTITKHFQDKIIIIDPKRSNWNSYAGCTVITPNMNELYIATGIANVDDDDRIYDLNDRYNIENILITRSEKGMTLVRRNKDRLDFPSKARQVYDVSGAGDTVVATLALALGSKLDIVTAIKIANVAAGLSVEKLGTTSITIEELINQLKGEQL